MLAKFLAILNPAMLIRIGALALPVFALAACSGGEPTLSYGFYAYFAPVSSSADQDPNADGFNTPLGYEADLLTALETMGDAELSFRRRAISEWTGIWLKSAQDEYDIIGGGITVREDRTLNAAGETVVTFTNGHIAFRQSLLVRTEDAGRLATYDDLTGDIVVGVHHDTTNEERLLQLTGLSDAAGVLAAGTRVDTDAGEIVADGSAAYTITAAVASPGLEGRRHLYPPADTMPQVVYLADSVSDATLYRMLLDGDIDAVAREEIDNSGAAHVPDGSLTVTALDSLIEYGGFTVAADNTDLLALLNKRIDWLTDHRRIGYPDWLADPTVFMQRAAAWGK